MPELEAAMCNSKIDFSRVAAEMGDRSAAEKTAPPEMRVALSV
jgi:hypothetical protein